MVLNATFHPMALDPSSRRRWIGALILLGAMGMLIAGETVLRDRLGPVATLTYWLVCLVLTGGAVMVALLDVRALQRRIRREQRDLFEATLKKIQSEAQAKPRPGSGRHNGAG